MNIPFWKMSGAGNDFVLVAGRRAGPALARRLCDRRRGVGADGLLSISRRGERARVDYRNADGSAAFCGNGLRCAALWAAAAGWVKGRSFILDTTLGPLGVRLTARGRAEIEMPAPSRPRLGLRLKALGRELTVHFVDAGVPHAVVAVPDVEAVDVDALGRALRFHKAFGRAGANVDFVSMRRGGLLLRTYERGVEAETLACGTGAVAAAAALGLEQARIRVRSGDILTVSLSGGARLEGPGKLVFTGTIEL